MSKKEIIGINLLRKEAKRPLVKKPAKPGPKIPFRPGRDTAIIAGLCLVFVVAFGGYVLKLNSTIENKEKLLIRKKIELRKLEKVYSKIRLLEEKKKDMQRMIEVIKALSAGRERMVRFFERLENDIPNNAWLNSLSLKGNSVLMKGYALEDNGVADLMENLSRERTVSKCSLSYIKEVKMGGLKVREFSLMTFFR